MNRIAKIQALKTKFSTEDLFCPHIIQKFGDRAWEYLSNEFVDNMYYFRFELFKAPMFVNYPKQGRVERGVRCNCCKITNSYTKKNEAYLTAHMLDGCDFDVQGFTAEEARNKIKANKDTLPHPIRLEKAVSWVHWDKRNYTDSKIVEF